MSKALIVDKALRDAGIPIGGVSVSGSSVTVDWGTATQEQITQGLVIIEATDISDDAFEAWKTAQLKEEAIAALAGSNDSTRLATRAALQVIHASIVEVRQTLNALIDHVNSGTGVPSKLAIRTFDQAVAAVATVINQTNITP